MCEEGICAICQGSLEDGSTFTIPTCNHEFHASCLFENYCHGNISCAICRTLPITNLHLPDTLENIASSYDEMNGRDEERFFRRGLNAARKGDCKNKKLVKAVQRYDSFMSRTNKAQQKERDRKKVRQQFVSYCNAAIEKILKLKKYEKLKTEYNSNTFKHTITGYKSVGVPIYKKRRKQKRLKSRVALAAGFKPMAMA
jgi:hypothetical protein